MRCTLGILLALLPLAATGCHTALSDPARATPAYPRHLHSAQSVDVQVLRDRTRIELVNATARSFADFHLWINQRYRKHVESLPAGESRRISLADFYDERGERLTPGGFFRTEAATPIWMVQIQEDDQSPLVGLITIVPEDD